MVSYQDLQESIAKGQRQRAQELISAFLKSGNSPNEIIYLDSLLTRAQLIKAFLMKLANGAGENFL